MTELETLDGPPAVEPSPEPQRAAPRSHKRKPAEASHPLLAQEAYPSPRQPWVGCPVQFCGDDGSIIPGVLQRESLAEPGIFDVKVSPHGAALWVTRYAVKHSETPKPGCWSFGPA